MQVGDDRRHGEAPLKAYRQVDDDADDDEQECQRAIFCEFLADLRTDELDAAERCPWSFGVERGHDRFADLCRVLLFLERQADHHVLAGAEVLHGDVGVTGLGQSAPDFLKIGRLGIVHFDQRAAGKLDREMQSVIEQKKYRQQEGEQRDDVEHQRVAHERDIFFKAEEFHLRTSLFG